jgi:hypothetical protein
MIQSKRFNLKYWVEDINRASYIVNHTPTKDFKNIKSKEACNKINRNISHFFVFGSVAWAHIPDEKRKFLQPKSEKCIFFGYYKYVKDYILLQPYFNEIFIRRDIKFDENILSYETNSMFV